MNKRQRKETEVREREISEKWEDEVTMEERVVHELGKEERGGHGVATEVTKSHEEKK